MEPQPECTVMDAPHFVEIIRNQARAWTPMDLHGEVDLAFSWRSSII